MNSFFCSIASFNTISCCVSSSTTGSTSSGASVSAITSTSFCSSVSAITSTSSDSSVSAITSTSSGISTMIVSSSFSSALTITDSSGACFSTSIVGCSISVLRLISSDNIVSSCSTLESTDSACRMFLATTSFSCFVSSIRSAIVS